MRVSLMTPPGRKYRAKLRCRQIVRGALCRRGPRPSRSAGGRSPATVHRARFLTALGGKNSGERAARPVRDVVVHEIDAPRRRCERREVDRALGEWSACLDEHDVIVVTVVGRLENADPGGLGTLLE